MGKFSIYDIDNIDQINEATPAEDVCKEQEEDDLDNFILDENSEDDQCSDSLISQLSDSLTEETGDDIDEEETEDDIIYINLCDISSEDSQSSSNSFMEESGSTTFYDIYHSIQKKPNYLNKKYIHSTTKTEKINNIVEKDIKRKISKKNPSETEKNTLESSSTRHDNYEESKIVNIKTKSSSIDQEKKTEQKPENCHNNREKTTANETNSKIDKMKVLQINEDFSPNRKNLKTDSLSFGIKSTTTKTNHCQKTSIAPSSTFQFSSSLHKITNEDKDQENKLGTLISLKNPAASVMEDYKTDNTDKDIKTNQIPITLITNQQINDEFNPSQPTIKYQSENINKQSRTEKFSKILKNYQIKNQIITQAMMATTINHHKKYIHYSTKLKEKTPIKELSTTSATINSRSSLFTFHQEISADPNQESDEILVTPKDGKRSDETDWIGITKTIENLQTRVNEYIDDMRKKCTFYNNQIEEFNKCLEKIRIEHLHRLNN